MVNASSWLLNHIGIATAQDGTRLFSAAAQGRPVGQWFDLNVDGPCSGLRSLFALMMAGAIFGWFRQRSLWRRTSLFLLSVPLALGANMVRIFILVVSSILFGQKFAIGEHRSLHLSSFHRYLCFPGGVHRAPLGGESSQPLVPKGKTTPAHRGLTMLIRGIIFAMLAALTVALCVISPDIKGGGEPGVVMQLPEQLGPWAGVKGEPDPVEVSVLPKDTEFAKMVYSTLGGNVAERDVINVSIVLSGADRRSIHRPEVCLRAQGWTILSSTVQPVVMEDGNTLRVRDLYITKPMTLVGSSDPRMIRAHYIYWFAGTNVSTPDHMERTWITLRDSKLVGINHRWAYPSMMAMVTEGFTPQETGQRVRTNEETQALLREFIKHLTPKFQKEYMPSKNGPAPGKA